jgi:carbon-monoxide dehydrogenase small subunit
MSEKDKKKEGGEISRREFLTGTGFLVGGAAVGVGGAALWLPEKEKEVLVDVPKYVCAYDSLEFASFSALTTHVETAHPEAPGTTVEGLIEITVNGKPYLCKVKPNWSLVFVLREKLGLTGTKIGCDRGTCGTCTVIVDGRPVYSCMVLATEADGSDIQTIEGISDGITLHPIQQAFVDNDAVQCGYCIPGFIMSAKALLDKNSNPTRDEVREALSGHLCICGHTKKIVDAVL